MEYVFFHHCSCEQLRLGMLFSFCLLLLDVNTEHKLTGPWAKGAFLVFFGLQPRLQIRTQDVPSPSYLPTLSVQVVILSYLITFVLW